MAALALMIAGCGSSPTATTTASPSPSANPPAAERVVAHFETLAGDLEASGSDCERVAAVLSDWTEKHRDEYARLSRQARDSAMAQGERQGHEERLRNAFSRILGAASACSEHAGAQAAFARFDEVVDSSPGSPASGSES